MHWRLGLGCLVALVVACGGETGSGEGPGESDSSDSSDGSDSNDSDSGVGPGVPCAGADVHSGEATYYDFADGSGNCSFPATPGDLMVAALNHTDYADSAACGSCVRIEGPQGTVDVRIVDRCPECPAGDIDLSPQAFAKIAALEAGRVPISWQYIACPVTGPVGYHFKDGSNQWWTAVQVRNHRHAVARFEFEQDGTWVTVPRLDYNFFVQDSGMGPGPFRFRVTDVLGATVEDDGIPLLDNAEAPGTGQFPGCSD